MHGAGDGAGAAFCPAQAANAGSRRKIAAAARAHILAVNGGGAV
jgi:hypothetical protein